MKRHFFHSTTTFENERSSALKFEGWQSTYFKSCMHTFIHHSDNCAKKFYCIHILNKQNFEVFVSVKTCNIIFEKNISRGTLKSD